MNNIAQPRESSSGPHLADFAILLFAAVKVARAHLYGQHAIVVTFEKMLTRGKSSEGLRLRRHCDQWRFTCICETQVGEMHRKKT